MAKVKKTKVDVLVTNVGGHGFFSFGCYTTRARNWVRRNVKDAKTQHGWPATFCSDDRTYAQAIVKGMQEFGLEVK